MTSQLLGSSISQLDGYLHGIKKEFDRLNQELDEARKQRDEYKTNYKNQEKELRELITTLFHRLNGKDQPCQYCSGEITHTAGLADDNPSISPVSSPTEYYSPSEEKSVASDRPDNTGSSKEIVLVEEERDHDGDVQQGDFSVENEDPRISGIESQSKEVVNFGWDIEYNGDSEIGLKLDLVHELMQDGQTHVTFSPDGKYLATATMTGMACIFDVNTGERISVMKDLHDEDVCYRCLDFSPDNNYLATGGDDGKVRIWIISQRRVRNIFVCGNYILDLHFSPNGNYVVTCSSNQGVGIWRLRDGFLRVFHGAHSPWAVRFSPDGRYVASGCSLPEFLIWNVRTRRLVARWEGHGRPITNLAFTPDGTGLLSASRDKTVICWEIPWLSSLGNFMDNEGGVNSTVTEVSRFVGYTGYVDTVSISPDGQWIASGSRDKTVRIWNAHDSALLCTLHGPDQIWSVAFSPVGTYLAIGGDLPHITVWNYANVG